MAHLHSQKTRNILYCLKIIRYLAVMRRILPLFFAQIVFLSVLSAQTSEASSDSYSDYSYLWESKPSNKKPKKDKKKKVKADESSDIVASPVLTDTLPDQKDPSDLLDSLTEKNPTNIAPADSLQVTPSQEDQINKAKKEEKEKKTRQPIEDFRAPLLQNRNGGNFTGGFTYTTIGSESFVGMTLSPEFTLGKVGVGLNVPILYGLESQKIRTEIFKEGVGAARLIRYIRYGNQKRDPIYVKVGQLDGLMIGFGGMVNNYSNTTSFEKRKVGLHFDANYKGYVGLEGMYSDFDPASQNLLVLRPYIRPLTFTDIPVVKTLEVGATLATDKDQTTLNSADSTASSTYTFTQDGVSALGLDMGLTVLKIPFIQIDLFANYTTLTIKNDSLDRRAASILTTGDFATGSGVSFGANFRLHFIANVFNTDIRIERLTYKDHYLPQFFDAIYEVNKDAKIASLITAEKKSGIYGSLTGHILQKVTLGGSLMIPDDISETSPAVVRVHAEMDRLANKFSFQGSYIKGNLSDLGDAFVFDQNSLAKMRFIYHLNKFLATGVDYYYAFTRVEDGDFKVTKTVMPYFGLSIDF